MPSYLMDANFPRGENGLDDTPYKYPHNYGGWVEQQYLPDGLEGTVFYQPSDNGYEKQIKAHMQFIRENCPVKNNCSYGASPCLSERLQ